MNSLNTPANPVAPSTTLYSDGQGGIFVVFDLGITSLVINGQSSALASGSVSTFLSNASSFSSNSYNIVDSSSNIAANLDALQTWVGKISSIAQNGTPSAMAITANQLSNDAAVLNDIVGNYSLAVSGVLAGSVVADLINSHISSLAVSDTAANLVANLAVLQANLGKISSITASNGLPILVSAAQQSADAGALALFQQGGGSYQVSGSHPTSGIATGSFVANASQAINISQLFSLSNSASAPTYLDICMSDRIEYPKGATPSSGTFIGSNVTAPVYLRQDIGSFKTVSENIEEAAILFTYQTSTGQYYNSTYGYLNQLTFKTGNFINENAEISIFATDNLNILSVIDPTTHNGSALYNAQYLAQYSTTSSSLAYCGTVDIVNSLASPKAIASATPNSIIAAANNYIGQVWNQDGCWVLASDIAATAGASLPATSMLCAVTPAVSGEWIAAYYGGTQVKPTIAAAEAAIVAGDIVTVLWAGGTSGHIFTVVSGSGANAKIIDNSGPAVNDGSNVDVLAGQYFTVDQEFTRGGAIASSVTVYRLDTPTITVKSPLTTLYAGTSISLAPLFGATDAGGAGSLPITQYAFYDVGSGGAQNNAFLINGATVSAHTSASEVIVSAANLNSVQLSTAAGQGGSDTVYVSAFNGNYWGDWSTLAVQEAASIAVNAAQPYTITSPNLAIMGTSGIDTTIINNSSTNFTINISANGVGNYAIVDNSGALGTTNLVNVDRLQFTNVSVALDTGVGQNAGEAYRLYQAAFARTPDAAGLGFWIYSLDSGAALQNAAQGFLNSTEFTKVYGVNPTNATFLTELYSNVLGRNYDQSGYNFWLSALNNGLARNSILASFSESPENVANVASALAHGAQFLAYHG